MSLKVFKWLGRLEEGVAGLLFVSGVVVSLYGVFMRYVLNAPPAWVNEIFELLFVWAIFIGFGMALKENRHIQVDIIFDRLSYTWKRIVSGFANIVGGCFAFFLAYSSIELITLTKEQGIKTIDVGMPLWITYLILPIGMSLLGLYFFVKSIRAFKGEKRELAGELEMIYEEAQETSKSVKEKGVDV